jgi:hypothetical protein
MTLGVGISPTLLAHADERPSEPGDAGSYRYSGDSVLGRAWQVRAALMANPHVFRAH